MRRLRTSVYGLVGLVGIWAIGTAMAQDQGNQGNQNQGNGQDPKIALIDNCDPNTFPNGLCVVLPHPGDTTFGEFLALLFSPNIDSTKVFVGHPAWRFEPSYLSIRIGQTVRLTNRGGEEHTFTEVSNFGGGSIGTLNGADVTLAPGCPAN